MSLREAAALFACDPAWIAAQLDPIAVPHPERGIPWEELAVLLCETFTPAELDAAAGNVPAFPALLRVSSVQWCLPAYLLIALEHLVANERALDPAASRLTVEAYVARQLSVALDIQIIDRLSIEPAFREAVHFPDES